MGHVIQASNHELLGPPSPSMAAGLKRLGVPTKARHYFELRAILDVKHATAWSRNPDQTTSLK